MNNIITFLFFWALFFLFFSNSAIAQTKEQREVIKQSMSSEDSLKTLREIEKYSTERKERINKFLVENPKEEPQFMRKRKVYVLYDITKSGIPIYRSLKNVTRKNKRKKCFKN